MILVDQSMNLLIFLVKSKDAVSISQQFSITPPHSEIWDQNRHEKSEQKIEAIKKKKRITYVRVCRAHLCVCVPVCSGTARPHDAVFCCVLLRVLGKTVYRARERERAQKEWDIMAAGPQGLWRLLHPQTCPLNTRFSLCQFFPIVIHCVRRETGTPKGHRKPMHYKYPTISDTAHSFETLDSILTVFPYESDKESHL